MPVFMFLHICKDISYKSSSMKSEQVAIQQNICKCAQLQNVLRLILTKLAV